MSKIILQPAGSSDAGMHYVDTIVNPVSIDGISDYVEPNIVSKLRELHKDGKVPTWGVTPGIKEVNKNKWEKVLPGDVVLFSRNNKIFASAAVSFTLHNKNLALNLWKTNSVGETWEYIYFLDEVINQDIPYEEFNATAGYKLNNIIQGFNVLDEEKSERIISHFELASETYYPPVSQEDYFNSLTLDASKALEREGTYKGRTEQAFLRTVLFKGNKYAKCGICGKQYPVSFLVTAHIKKRASCTDEEKRDYKNIVMPMCKFGCDELYEKGFIAVDGGAIVSTNQIDSTDAMEKYMSVIVGNNCLNFTEDSKKYFDFHLQKYKRKLK